MMKFGPLEGSQQEITDFFENNGLRPEAYFQALEAPLERRWMVIPASLVCLVLVLIVLVGSRSSKLLLILVLAGVATGAWLAASVQLRFRSATVTWVVGLSIMLLLLLAAGLITPKEAVDYLPKVKPKEP